jgi:hypothetical protein
MGQILSLPLRRKACGGFFHVLKKSNGFEPANSGSRGQHANHQTTEAVNSDVKMPCKQVSLSLGDPLGNLGGILLAGTFGGKKDSISGPHSWIQRILRF